MRQLCSLILTLSLAALLVGCGPHAATAPPSAEDPVHAYMESLTVHPTTNESLEQDVALLSQESLDLYDQYPDLISRVDGTAVRIDHVVGDTRDLFLSYEITFPEDVDMKALGGSVTLEIPDLDDEMSDRQGDWSQTDPRTVKGIFSLARIEPMDPDITVVLSVTQGTCTEYTFRLSIPAAQIRTADLTNAHGYTVGTLSISHFGYAVTVPDPASSQVLLNLEDIPFSLNAADEMGWASWPTVRGFGSTTQFFQIWGSFRMAIEPDQVKTAVVGDLTATF